jgi:hypothetical protein
METKNFFVYSYDEFNKLVNEKLPSIKERTWPYEFVAEQDANNYSCYKFENIGETSKDESPECMYRRFDVPDIEKGKLRNTHALLEYLCEKGIIQPGNYLIEVFW